MSVHYFNPLMAHLALSFAKIGTNEFLVLYTNSGRNCFIPMKQFLFSGKKHVLPFLHSIWQKTFAPIMVETGLQQ